MENVIHSARIADFLLIKGNENNLLSTFPARLAEPMQNPIDSTLVVNTNYLSLLPLPGQNYMKMNGG